ncbi:hypothetical protein [Pseudomonas putida]|uniref:hypothetical protein n=1 Tax=Pseudomonas putida TaxID=303 RepID=UPI0008190BCD|nr:hypothetical protein [Pseudomonas putida]OCT29579.1 hypothetical protein A6E20_03955 [Pseudomonas putida]OCT31275.1 hypothetical protein A6E23_01710 [Pseudomonas putida]OCT33517.1 hypothetical protein A6E24_00895 [Pseudomonas putida]OCT39963.1 hypothetical protein A6E19_00900 [Pseudomonas putida]
MSKPLLLCTVLFLPLTCAHAVDTSTLPREQLLELGARLEASSGSSQWQQLWQQVRGNGLLQDQPEQLRFAPPPSELPAMVRLTLAQAQHVDPFATTHARYRRVFSPQIIGYRASQALEALCVDVDWRALPAEAVSAPQSYLGLASLRKAYPCE